MSEIVANPTCELQKNLRFGLGLIGNEMGWICCNNKELAEPHSILPRVTYLTRLKTELGVVFFDGSCGVPVFSPAINRTLDDWWEESLNHGWPSFRDPEVLWGNVIRKPNGEIISSCGTHLGHDIPDENGPRYCINLLCISGRSSNLTATNSEIRSDITSSQIVKERYQLQNATDQFQIGTMPQHASFSFVVIAIIVLVVWMVGVWIFLQKKKRSMNAEYKSLKI